MPATRPLNHAGTSVPATRAPALRLRASGVDAYSTPEPSPLAAWTPAPRRTPPVPATWAPAPRRTPPVPAMRALLRAGTLRATDAGPCPTPDPSRAGHVGPCTAPAPARQQRGRLHHAEPSPLAAWTPTPRRHPSPVSGPCPTPEPSVPATRALLRAGTLRATDTGPCTTPDPSRASHAGAYSTLEPSVSARGCRRAGGLRASGASAAPGPGEPRPWTGPSQALPRLFRLSRGWYTTSSGPAWFDLPLKRYRPSLRRRFRVSGAGTTIAEAIGPVAGVPKEAFHGVQAVRRRSLVLHQLRQPCDSTSPSAGRSSPPR